MRINLVLDLIAVLGLAFSPWILGCAAGMRAPHLVIGVLELVTISLSVSVSGTEPGQKTSTH